MKSFKFGPLAIVVFAITLILTPTFVSAQELTLTQWGGKVGFSSSSLSTNGDWFDSHGSRSAFVIGGFGIVAVEGQSFLLQPEALFVQKGMTFKVRGDDYSFELNYLEIPLLTRWMVGQSGNAYLLAGPSLSLNLSSKLTSGGESEDLDGVAGTDLGLMFGAGLQRGDLSFEARWDHGLSDASTDSDTAKNRSLSLVVGYTLPR